MMNEDTAFARQAIQELAARYSDALSRRDWQTFESCWLWESTYKTKGPSPIEICRRDAITKEMKAMFGQTETFFQATQPGVIEVFGREAKARFPFVEYRRTAGDERGVTVFGFYDDEFRWGMTGQWQLEKRTCTIVSWGEPLSYSAPIKIGA